MANEKVGITVSVKDVPEVKKAILELEEGIEEATVLIMKAKVSWLSSEDEERCDRWLEKWRKHGEAKTI